LFDAQLLQPRRQPLACGRERGTLPLPQRNRPVPPRRTTKFLAERNEQRIVLEPVLIALPEVGESAISLLRIGGLSAVDELRVQREIGTRPVG
jgi:hypothetical protein